MGITTARIFFVNHAAELGGGELALFDFVSSEAARLRGAGVILLSDGPLGGRLKAAGVPVDILNAGSVLTIRRGDGPSALLRVPRLLLLVLTLTRRFQSADLIYANSQKALIVCALATLVRRRPLVWHLHDILDSQHFSGFMRRVAISLSNLTTCRVIANSAATEDAYRAGGGKIPVTVVHNGIDPIPYTTANRNRSALRAALAMQMASGGSKLLGLFGRLSHWKGQHVAIRALVELPNCHLVLIGGALFGEEHYAAGLRRLAVELGVADRLHFLGFRSDIAALMVSFDVVLHTSITPEPFGRVIVEAMMAGSPVIAAGAGGACEIIEDGLSGRLILPGDAGALANAVRKLLGDAKGTQAIADAGCRRAHAHFSLSRANAHIARIIDDIAAAGS